MYDRGDEGRERDSEDTKCKEAPDVLSRGMGIFCPIRLLQALTDSRHSGATAVFSVSDDRFAVKDEQQDSLHKV